MGCWTGVSDYLGLEPVNSPGAFFRDALRVVAAPSTFGKAWADGPGGYTGSDAWRDMWTSGGPVGAGLSSLISDNVSTTMDGSLEAVDTLRENGLSDYIGDLFQTDADAALDQALVNENLSENAWKRSEQSADAAQARARELRQTYYQDLMHSLKEAGLNPVLAASGGFGGVSSSAPMGTSQAASSQKADGLNAANLLAAIAAILNGAGSILGGITRSSPAGIIAKGGKIGF